MKSSRLPELSLRELRQPEFRLREFTLPEPSLSALSLVTLRLKKLNPSAFRLAGASLRFTGLLEVNRALVNLPLGVSRLMNRLGFCIGAIRAAD